MSPLAAAARIFIALVSFLTLFASIVPHAAAQAGVNGRNATAVDFGQGAAKQGEFRQTGPRQWAEINQKGETAFRFEETNRDEWSVYLVDRSRGVEIQLDLYTRKVMFGDGRSPRRPLYDISGARSQPAPPTAASVPASPSSAPAPSPGVTTPKPPVAVVTPKPAPKPTTEQIALDATQRALFGAQEPDICWKESYGRGAGVVPDVCPSGFERTGADLLCYPVCKPGFGGVGPVCWQNCPAGFRNDGAFCAKPEPYGRGVGFGYNIFTEGRDAAQQRCEREHGAGNCERNLEMFYPKCRAGFVEAGSNICSPACPAGMTDIGVSCSKQSYGRGVGEGGTCKVGMQQDFKGGLCYPQCQPGTTGVGPVCWHGCPAAYPVNCGAACGVSQSACAFAIIEQVQSSTELVLNVAAMILSAGTASGPLRSAQSAGRGARRSLTTTARNQMKQQVTNQLENALKWQRKLKNVERAQGWLDRASNVTTAADMLVTKYETGEFDFMSLAPSVADVEPTGVLAVVNSFNKPICR